MSSKSKRWRKNSDSPHTTTVSPSPESPGVKSDSASSTRRKSRSSGPSVNQNLRQRLISPIGYGEQDDQRTKLLAAAGFHEETLAQVVKRSMRKKLELLEATVTHIAAKDGVITDTKAVPDPKVQLAAARALDDVLGVKAPPARQSVTVVHKLELPSWMCPDDQPNQVVEIQGTVIEEGNHDAE